MVASVITVTLLDFIEKTTLWKSCRWQISTHSIADCAIASGVLP